MKKISLTLLFLFNILFLIYLFSPIPKIPDLMSEYKSVEPGDTVQISNVKAFYTDFDRQKVINYYLDNYAKKHLFFIKINHPPERSKQIFRDTMQSYYLEEIIFPLKQSLYINGFEWENDVFTKPEKRIKNALMVGETLYKAKITLRFFSSNVFSRLTILISLNIFFLTSRIVIRKIFHD